MNSVYDFFFKRGSTHSADALAQLLFPLPNGPLDEVIQEDETPPF